MSITNQCEHNITEHDALGLWCSECREYISRSWWSRAWGWCNDSPSRFDWLALLGLLALLERWSK